MAWRGGGQFPDEDDRDGSRSVCFLAIKSPVVAASHRMLLNLVAVNISKT